MPQLLHTSAAALEFERLREIVRGCCQSELGQHAVDSLAPTTDAAWIDRQQQLTTEVRAFLHAGGRFDFGGLIDTTQLIQRARIKGATLETIELRDAILLIDRAAEWREAVMHPPQALREPWPAIEELSSAIEDFTPLLRYFANKFAPDGTLDDNASSALGSIRREIEKQRRGIQNSLRSYLRRLSEGDALQDELVTIRGDRFVIPVKTEQKRRVQGVVHGASSSGQTVFVEPLETIEQNNELVRLLEDEQREIQRILLEMTSHLGQQSEAILGAVEVLRELELQFAKARFAEQYQCARVKLLTDDSANSLVLIDARHPVMERNLRSRGRTVVPLTLEMDRTQRQLIISGPNTGGKTVALKTVGLLTLMAQAGIPVPAERADLPICDAVLADIGDSQSIEQNLSTFSAHVTNIDFISHTATAHSLVLLDELGSATDPEEGAALAVAIAEHFRQAAALTIISTHHTALKIYATNSHGVLNAAVGFDEKTLAPTYELRVGVPGASAGINIAQQIGLNPQIVADARRRLSTQTQDIAGFLDQLHSDIREIEIERLHLRQREQEVARERSRLEAEGLKEQRDKIRDLEKKLDSLMRDFEYHAREAVASVQDRAAAQKLGKEAERRIAKARREFREQFNQTVVAHTTGADEGDENARPYVVARVSVGDTVQLKSIGRTGRVVRKLEGEALEVQIGPMKMRIPLDDIAAVIGQAANNPVQAARNKGIYVQLRDEDSSAPTELNVIGRNVDEATAEVEKFIDRAFLAGLTHIRIVHGSGMGILRRALREYLKRHPQVVNVTEPPQNQGGGGATEVELKV
ncbi:MAG TPA: endonuclease MutS2 [Candidatus Saccharimonadales bacterium]|nr:endonuclease MutS2 [Candidatus Saccharimonadales bacterium]